MSMLGAVSGAVGGRRYFYASNSKNPLYFIGIGVELSPMKAPKVSPTTTGRLLPIGLWKRGNRFYVRIIIPPSVRDQFGGNTHLQEALGTSHEPAARTLHPQAYARLKDRIELARRDSNGVLMGRGRETESEVVAREFRALWTVPATRDQADDLISDEVDRLRGQIIGETWEGDTQVPVYEGDAPASRFVESAYGSVTDWAEEAIRDRANSWGESYRSRVRKASKVFLEWYREQPANPPLIGYDRVSTRIARRFLKELEARGDLTVGTMASYARALGGVWGWAVETEQPNASNNPWREASRVLRSGKSNPAAKRRAPSDEEIVALWNGPARPRLAQAIRFGVLTGARLEEIGRLKVSDVEGDELCIRGGKTRAAIRRIPIHSELTSLVAALTKDRSPDEYLIEGLIPIQGRRTHGLSQRFTAYRKALSLGANEAGRRDSTLVFHSFRHWFLTAALNAGCIKVHAQAVIGHAPDKGVTTSVYYKGPTRENRRAVVDAIKLPEGCRI